MNAATVAAGDCYAAARECFEGLLGFMDGADAVALDHDALGAAWTPKAASCCAKSSKTTSTPAPHASSASPSPTSTAPSTQPLRPATAAA